MKVILVSDTHDNKKFFEALATWNRGKDLAIAIHAGDHIAPFTVDWMEKAGLEMVYGVLGNNDGEVKMLYRKYNDRGWSLKDLVNEIELDGVKIAVTHGTMFELPKILALSGRYDVVVYGHTHQKHVEWVGDTLLVNPGEACGYLTGESTFMVLDLDKKEVEEVKLHL